MGVVAAFFLKSKEDKERKHAVDIYPTNLTKPLHITQAMCIGFENFGGSQVYGFIDEGQMKRAPNLRVK